MYNFSENAKVHYLLNQFVLDVIYRYDGSGELWDAKYLNSIDRKDLSEQYVNMFSYHFVWACINSQLKSIDKINTNVFTDDDGISYNSVIYKN